jgi:serine/threonine-protein kinase
MVHDAVTAYLEGVQLLAHRRSAAAAVLARARQARERFEALQGDLETARRALQAIRSNLDPFSPRNEKEVLWLLEDRREALAREHDRCFREAANLAHQALELDPELPEARRALVGLYVERLDQIEQQGNLAEQPLLESLIQRYDDGTYGARLSATATVTVRSDLPGMVTAYRLVEDERRLRPADEHPVGETPVTATLEPGRWLLMVKRDGCLDARYPLRVRRGQHLELNAWLPLAGEIPPDFLYVPAGAAPLGGDPEAFEEELTEIEVPAFAIARHPVTCGEYLEFLNALIHHAPEEARRRVPRGPNRAPRWLLGSDGRYRLPLIDAEGDAITARQPVMLVNAWDAEAYCAWRSGRYGLPFRLPTPAEWEKAARGADGRFFPWGDRFDASFCNSRPARGVRPRLEPVGTFPEDTSPYGVMEMAGGVSELTAGQGEHPRRVCGGAFFLSGPQCRLARRVDQAPDQEAPSVGFRICFSLNR